MYLYQINLIQSQVFERSLYRTANIFFVVANLGSNVNVAALRSNPRCGKPFAEYLFAFTSAVRSRRIEIVDTALNRSTNGSDDAFTLIDINW